MQVELRVTAEMKSVETTNSTGTVVFLGSIVQGPVQGSVLMKSNALWGKYNKSEL